MLLIDVWLQDYDEAKTSALCIMIGSNTQNENQQSNCMSLLVYHLHNTAVHNKLNARTPQMVSKSILTSIKLHCSVNIKIIVCSVILTHPL